MKLNYIIVLGFLIAFTVSDAAKCELNLNPTSKKDCNGKITDADIADGDKYCCYYEVGTYKVCMAFSQAEYDNIGETKNSMGGLGGTVADSTFKIECNSSYLKLGLLSLLFFIF